MRPGAGVVTDPYAKILNFLRAFLMDLAEKRRLATAYPAEVGRQSILIHLIQADYLSIRLLDLPEFHQKIPESRLRDHGVRSEYAHPVQLGGRVGLGRQMPPDDLVLCKTP